MIRSKIGAALCAAGMLTAGLCTTAAAPSTDVSCYITTAHNGAGAGSFTLQVYRDNCGLPIRATALCNYWFTSSRYWHHGRVIGGPGYSQAQCGSGVASVRAWGYDDYYRGQWIYNQLGSH